MKLVLISYLVMVGGFACKAQNLAHVLQNSKITTHYSGYFDEASVNYYSGDVTGMDTKVFFDSVYYNRRDSNFSISGQVVLANLMNNERWGFCCLNIFIAQTRGDSLIYLEKIGTVNNNQISPDRPDGYFELKIRPTKEQKLFFCTDLGMGLNEYSFSDLIEAVYRN